MDSDAKCLMADCNEPQGHFCFTHTVEVFGSRAGLAAPDAAAIEVLLDTFEALMKQTERDDQFYIKRKKVLSQLLAERLGADAVRQARRETWKAAITTIRLAQCGLCQEVAKQLPGYKVGPAVIFDGHYTHLWKHSGDYAQRCAADAAVKVLEAAALRAEGKGNDV